MTKKQFHSVINKDVYDYMEQYFPEFIIGDSEEGGRIYFVDSTSPTPIHDSIEYHQSRHTLCTLDWTSERVKDVERELESWINALIKQYQ
jgi:hypothetical protein